MQSPDSALIRKLQQFVTLSDEDKVALADMAQRRVRKQPPREDIIAEGDAPKFVYLMLEGWACRYKTLADGRRQILSYFLPGDLCDLTVFILREMDHSIGTLTPVTYAEVDRDALQQVTLDHPRVTQALWWETLVNIAIQREWTINLGQRTAAERLAHLLCELFLRLRGVGLTNGNSCHLPLTQTELADTTGLSAVHVNRTLQDLRAANLIVLNSRSLTIPDLEALKAASQFNMNYLHLNHAGNGMNANDVAHTR